MLQDNEIVKLAIAENRIIITKDSDFLDNYLLKGTPPKILLLKVDNIDNNDMLHIIDLYLKHIVSQYEAHADVVILSKTQIITY